MIYLDFHTVENLAIVNTHNRANHLWHNDHVAQVSLDHSRLLVVSGFFLSRPEFLEQSHMLALQSAAEATANPGAHHLQKLVPGSKPFSIQP